MDIKQIGEFGLIKKFRKSIKVDSSVVVGSGDDCAVLKFDKDNFQLFTCDMIVEGIDFRSQENPELIGRKALAISISDIASCGGIPRHAVVSIGVSKSFSLARIERIARGLFNLARTYKINIVGGDLSRSRCLVIDLSLLGIVEKKNLVLRSGAKAGDYIFVSGLLGGSIRGKHLKFTPRLKEARFLVENFKVNAMIDISDGLAQDLGHILKSSEVGAVIFKDSIPLSKDARDFNDALYSGEDFELLFTLSPKHAKKLLKRNLYNFKLIGQIRDKGFGLKLINRSGRCKNIEGKGFRHF